MLTIGSKTQWTKSDFFFTMTHRTYVTAHDAGNKLRPKTDAEQWFLAIDTVLYKFDFIGQKRIYLFIVSANRGPTDDDKICLRCIVLIKVSKRCLNIF